MSFENWNAFIDTVRRDTESRKRSKKESDKGNAATDHTTTAAGKRKGSPERGHPKSAKHDSR